ncbi:MAG: 5-formyltetrahydrofolate cyclo-ligase [Acidothermaceae bacterium]
MDIGSPGPAKQALRTRLLAARARRPGNERTAAGDAIARVLERYLIDLIDVHPIPEERANDPGVRLVAAYLSVGFEPETGPLLERLAGLGVRTIVPVLLDDRDLDWAAYAPGDPVGGGLRATVAPESPRLGVAALGWADLVIVPALAVDRRGRRLGRGGGSYDRALTRVREGVPVLAVVHDDEILDEVTALPHDRAVDGVVTPSGVAFFGSDPAS